jgi:hypothetical protein
LLAGYAEVMHDIHGISGITMNEIIRAARRELWGQLPGDHDSEDDELTTLQASRLPGISVSALGVRILRGGLPARCERRRTCLRVAKRRKQLGFVLRLAALGHHDDAGSSLVCCRRAYLDPRLCSTIAAAHGSCVVSRPSSHFTR